MEIVVALAKKGNKIHTLERNKQSKLVQQLRLVSLLATTSSVVTVSPRSKSARQIAHEWSMKHCPSG
jgi:hypothetical protein